MRARCAWPTSTPGRPGRPRQQGRRRDEPPAPEHAATGRSAARAAPAAGGRARSLRAPVLRAGTARRDARRGCWSGWGGARPRGGRGVGVGGAAPGAAGNGPPHGPTAWLAPPAQIAQINHSHTALRGTLRGLHYQRPPHAEGKLVSCLRGAVWDVALDLRQGSPTFLHWHAECLSADNGCALLIPPGFAHGFQALTDDAELLYCHWCAHAPAAQAGLHPLEPRLAIGWPLTAGRISPRGAGQGWLTPDFQGLCL